MAKWKSYAERMQEKYGAAPAVAPGISGSTKGKNAKSNNNVKNSSSALNGSKEGASYLERMTAKYGNIQTPKQPTVDVQKQRDVVKSVGTNKNLVSTRSNSNNLSKKNSSRRSYLESMANAAAIDSKLNSIVPGMNASQQSYVNAVKNNFIQGQLPTTQNIAAAKAKKTSEKKTNSNDFLTNYAKKQFPELADGLDAATDNLIYGTYKENKASRKANQEMYASANPNWNKKVSAGPVANGYTARNDVYEYLNDPDADKYIKESFTKKGNEISSSARMFDSDAVERLGTMPDWIKRSSWYQNATEQDKKDRSKSKTLKFSLDKGIYTGKKYNTTNSDVEVFNNMSEDEQKEYSYLLGKYGEDKATAYLDTIKTTVNEREAERRYKQWLNEGADGLIDKAARYGKTLAGAAGNGLETFHRGVTDQFINATSGTGDVSTPSASEILYQKQRANYSGVAGVGLDLAQNSTMMAPTVAAGTAAAFLTGGATTAGEIASLASTIAPMTFGNAYEEAVNGGADVKSAQKYAMLEALNEAGGEYLLGGIENVTGGFSRNWAKGALKKIAGATDGTVSTVAKAMNHFLSTPEGRYIFSMGSEGFEEIVQGTVQNYLKNSVLGANETLNPFTEDNLYSALIAALSAGVSNAAPYVNARRIGKNINLTAQDVRENAELISTNETDYIDEKTGDIDQQAYDDAMAQREQMLEQADYMEQGGSLTNAETAELAAANGGRLGSLHEAGVHAALNEEADYEQMAERIANADALSNNDEVHTASNEAFDNAMAMAERAANNEQISNVEKGKAAIKARNIEVASNIEQNMRNAVRETNENKIADNKSAFKEYSAEKGAGLYTEESRNNMVSLYDGTVDADKYRDAYQRAYAAGFNNIDSTTAYNSMNMLYLNDKQKLQAYKDGMHDSNVYANNKVQFIQGEARTGGLTEGTELVNENTGKFLDWAGKKTGVKIKVVEGLKGAAEINLDKGEMKINPYTENFVSAASHEFTHLIKQYDRAAFNKLQKLTVESLMKSNNMSYEDLYRKYEKSYTEQVSSDYTVEDILEEITADGATAYLNDEAFAEKLAKEDKSLAKKIADFFREIADTLKSIIDQRGVRAVGKTMRENEARYRTAANIWYQALENAGEKYKSGAVATTETKYDAETGEAIDSQILSELNDKGVTVEGGAAVKYSLDTWNETDKDVLLDDLVYAGYDKAEANKWIKDVSTVAAVIAKNPNLDYTAGNGSWLKDNAETIKSLDGSFLCPKKSLFQGTYNAILDKLPDFLFDVNGYIELKNLMSANGYEVPCVYCYNESRLQAIGQYAGEFIKNIENDKVVKNVSSEHRKLKFTVNDLTTNSGIEKLESNYPDVFNAWIEYRKEAHGTQRSIKFEARNSAYRRENIMSLSAEERRAINNDSGVRWFAFSDFKTEQMIDCMQATLDLAAMNMKSYAYTKQENFVNVFGNTNIIINLSVAGSLENGKLVFDSDNGMDIKTARKLRKKYPNTAGICLVGMSDEHILKAMATDDIDMIIPFHRSGLSNEDMKALGIGNYTDYQQSGDQNEHWVADGKKCNSNLLVSDYWNAEKTGKENAQRYLKECARTGRIPKFAKFLDKKTDSNGRVIYTLKEDGSTDGFYKLLVDHKMYDNDGAGIVQQEVVANFDMAAAKKILSSYDGEKDKLPIAQKIVDHYVDQYSNSKTKFQAFNDPVEYTKDLIAVRNVSSRNLASMLELEGMPSPSIAITKGSLGHTQFGDVTFIFGRDTIDPAANSKNMAFTADAWTPTFDQIGVDTEIKSDNLKNISDKYYAFGQNNTMFHDTPPDAENFRVKFNRYDGNLHEMADNSYDWKMLYLNDKGDPVKIKTETINKPYAREASNEEIIKLADTKLKDVAIKYFDLGQNEQGDYLQNNRDEIKNIYEEITGRKLFEDEKRNFIKNLNALDILRGIFNYVYEKSTSYVRTDYDGAKIEIDKKIDTKDYHNWVDKNLKGVIGRKGIRNDKDTFTNIGNRRSFNQLHDAYTAKNIVKTLWKNAEQGVSSFGMAGGSARTLRGAAAGKFSNINEMHERSNLLQSDTESNVNAAIDEADSKLLDIYSKAFERSGSGRSIEQRIGFENSYNEAVMKAATKARTATKVKEYFAKEDVHITDAEAKQLLSIFDELRNLPTDYFEAKAKRVVGWDEVKLALVPDDIDTALIDRMHEVGIEDIRTYPAGNDEIRAKMENQADDLKFMLNIDDDPEWNYYANMVIESNQETKDAADTLGELLSTIDYVPSAAAIERTAKKLKKYTATDTDVQEIASQLKTTFDYLAANNNVDGREVSAILADYCGQLIDNSSKVEYDPVAERTYKEFRKAIKGYTFHLPAGFEGELETLGGIRYIRSQSGMAINLTKDKGMTMDQVYQELSEMYPDMFDRDITNPADQLEYIVAKLSALKPKPVVSYANEEDYDAYRYYAGQEVFKAYINEGIAEAGHKAEYRELQKEYGKKLKENAKTEKEMAALQAKAAEMQARYLSELEASRQKISRQTAREREYQARKSIKTRYWKDQIMKTANELSNWMLKPTDKKHVPEALKQPLANFLTQLDFTSKNLAADGEPTQRSLHWMQLKDTWAKIAADGGIADSEYGRQYMIIDTDILDKMGELTNKIKDIKKLEELEYVDVLKLNDVMMAMKHSIETANEMITLNRSVHEVSRETLDHLSKLKTADKNSGLYGSFKDVMTNRMLEAGTRFHTFGTAAESIYNQVRKGFDKKVFHTREASDWFNDAVAEVADTEKAALKEVRSWSNDSHEITVDGHTVTMSSAQIMNLYNLMKRPQALDHILKGGITLSATKVEKTFRDKITGRISDSVNLHVNKLDVANMVGELTDAQKKFADRLAETMQKVAAWGNDTSMEMMGYKKFNDRAYWPIKSSREYLATTMDAAAAGGIVGVSVKNAGPTKSTVSHANNPILIGDAIDVWTEHVNFMANYNAFTAPLTDLIKWYNYIDFGDAREGDVKFKGSIKEELARTFGKGADRYIMSFVEQINGMGRPDTSFANALISAFKGSAVGANLSVAIQQPTAIFRAMAAIEPKYLLSSMAHKPRADWNTVTKYSAIAQWKDWGFYEIDTGKSMKSILTGQDGFVESLNDKQMWLAGKGDEVTWHKMWGAAEQKVKSTMPELEAGSDEFYKAAAEIFDDVINKTQVVDSVFTKSDLMRSKNELNKMLTQFFAEPTKSYNMLYRAVFDYQIAAEGTKNATSKAALKTAGQQLAMSVMGFILSNVFASMAKSIVQSMRDSDRDKEFWDRWFAHVFDNLGWDVEESNTAKNVMSTVLATTTDYIPYLRDAYSILSGYSVTRPDLSMVQELYYTVGRWQKYIAGEGKYTISNNLLYTTKTASTFTGIAFYGFYRDLNGIIDTAIEAFGADELAYKKYKLTGTIINKDVNTYLAMAMKAYKSGSEALGNKIISDMIAAGISEEDIEQKKKNLLKKDEKLQTLIDATASNNTQEAENIKQQLLKEGYSESSIESVVQSGIGKQMSDSNLTYDGMNEMLDQITDYTKSGYAEFNVAYKEWAELVKIRNGWDDKKCREQFRSACTRYFKPKYKEGNSAERSRILNILSRAKSTDGTKIYAKDSDIKKWADN